MDKLVKDVRVLMDDTEELLRTTAAQTGEKVVEARDKVRQAVSGLKPALEKAQTAVTERATQVASDSDAYVRENPWTMTGIAAAIGIFIGVVIGFRWTKL